MSLIFVYSPYSAKFAVFLSLGIQVGNFSLSRNLQIMLMCELHMNLIKLITLFCFLLFFVLDYHFCGNPRTERINFISNFRTDDMIGAKVDDMNLGHKFRIEKK